MNERHSRTECRGRFRSVGALFVLALTLGSALAAFGESKRELKKDYALIFGTVWSAQNRPVYGARVKIRRAEEKKAKWQLTSDHNGEFAQRVPAGAADYVVWAELPKHKGPVAETKVHIDHDERADIGLHLKD